MFENSPELPQCFTVGVLLPVTVMWPLLNATVRVSFINPFPRDALNLFQLLPFDELRTNF